MYAYAHTSVSIGFLPSLKERGSPLLLRRWRFPACRGFQRKTTKTKKSHDNFNPYTCVCIYMHIKI